MPLDILLVDGDRHVLETLADALTKAGVSVSCAEEFEPASRLLKSRHFDVLITAHRLGAHNGLHLVLRARAENGAMLTLVSSAAPDPVLEAEATMLGARCLVAPWTDPQALLALIRASEPA